MSTFPENNDSKKDQSCEQNPEEVHLASPKKKSFFLYFRSIKPLILSHHPFCQTFENHTIRIGSRRFCIGCYVGYPATIFTLLFIYFARLYIAFGSGSFFLIGALLLSTFALSLLHLTESRRIKILQKASMGVGSGFLFWGIWSTPNDWITNFLSSLALFGALFLLFNAYHAYGLHRSCKKCEYGGNWGSCPGFEFYFEYLKAHDLPDFLNLKDSDII